MNGGLKLTRMLHGGGWEIDAGPLGWFWLWEPDRTHQWRTGGSVDDLFAEREHLEEVLRILPAGIAAAFRRAEREGGPA